MSATDKQKTKKNKIGASADGSKKATNKIGQAFAEDPEIGPSGEPCEPAEPSTQPLESCSSSTSEQIHEEFTRPEHPDEEFAATEAAESHQPPWVGDVPEDSSGQAPIQEDARPNESEEQPGRPSVQETKAEWKRDRWTPQEWQQWYGQKQYPKQQREWHRPQQDVNRSWINYVQVSADGLLSIRLAKMGLDERSMQSFCSWFPTELRRLKEAKVRKLYVSSDDIVLAHEVDISQNDLSDEAMRILLLTLRQARVVIGAAKFYRNKFSCRSAQLLAQWIRSAPWAIFELHLSHNQIKTAGALELIRAVAENRSYPSARPGSKNWPLPLWLRLEANNITEVDGFEQQADSCLQTARPEARGKLICWWEHRNRCGCRSDSCGYSTKHHCPVLHIPRLHQPETRKEDDSMHRKPQDGTTGQRHVSCAGDFRMLPSEDWCKIHSSFAEAGPSRATASAQLALEDRTEE